MPVAETHTHRADQRHTATTKEEGAGRLSTMEVSSLGGRRREAPGEVAHPTASVLFALARGRLAFTWGVFSCFFLVLAWISADRRDIASERPHGTILRVPSVWYIAHHTPRGSSVVLRFSHSLDTIR